MENIKIEDVPDFVEGPTKAFRLGKLPDWKFGGWQIIFFFGKIPDAQVPLSLQLGWRTTIIGIFKLRESLDENIDIKSEHIRGGILQAQIWIPFDGFGKL